MDIQDDLVELRRLIKRQLAAPGEFVRVVDETSADAKARGGRRKASRHGARSLTRQEHRGKRHR